MAVHKMRKPACFYCDFLLWAELLASALHYSFVTLSCLPDNHQGIWAVNLPNRILWHGVFSRKAYHAIVINKEFDV